MIYRKRRALSSVVSGGILLSAVAIMGTMLVAWSSSTFAVEQNELNESYAAGVNKLNEYVIFENVWFGNIPSKFLNVTLSNVGNVGLNVTKITIEDSGVKSEIEITNGGILPNNHFSTKIIHDWKSNESIKLIATTDRGKIYQTFVMGS